MLHASIVWKEELAKGGGGEGVDISCQTKMSNSLGRYMYWRSGGGRVVKPAGFGIERKLRVGSIDSPRTLEA